MDFEKLEIDHAEPDTSKMNSHDRRKLKLDDKEKRRDLYENICKQFKSTYQILDYDEDFKQMRQAYKKEFFDRWTTGFSHYIKGEWDIALSIFSETKVTRS